MAALGLVECLRHFKGTLTPTFKNTVDGEVKHQIDHMFVTSGLATRLLRCKTGAPEKIFAADLRDHLPIEADFRPMEALFPFNPILLGSVCFSWKLWGIQNIYRMGKGACT